MINKSIINQQYCIQCGEHLLDQIGSQTYCSNCQIFVCPIQQELKVVPLTYQSNHKNQRQLQSDRKLQKFIREFSDKVRDICTHQEMKRLINKLLMIKREIPKKKGTREAAAVIVYIELFDEIRLSIKQYCKANKVDVKIFNKKYKMYWKVFPKSSNEPAQELDFQKTKFEEKIEDRIKWHSQNESDGQKEEVSSKSKDDIYGESNQSDIKIDLKSAERAIDAIFDGIFTKFYFKEKKGIIINKLALKLTNINQKILNSINYEENTSLKIYYCLFWLLKSLQFKISFSKYNQIVKNRTGFILQRRICTELTTLFDSCFLEQDELPSQSLIMTADFSIKEEAEELISNLYEDSSQ